MPEFDVLTARKRPEQRLTLHLAKKGIKQAIYLTMLRRSTISKSSISASLKQRQLSHLHSQLAQLEANLADFESLIKITTHQAEYIKKLGIMHGSLFMASHKIFEEEVRAQEDDVTSDADQEQVQEQ